MRNLFIFSTSLLIFISCNKEVIESPPSITDYTPITVGNYWIYEHFTIKSDGTELSLNRFDSVYISKDTVMNGNTYACISKTTNSNKESFWGNINYVRDSANYLVDNFGKRIISLKEDIDTLDSETLIYQGDTLYYMSWKMIFDNSSITVPAGSFEVIQRKKTLYSKLTDPNIPLRRYMSDYYSKNIGLISETYCYLASPDFFEKRLVRYQVK